MDKRLFVLIVESLCGEVHIIQREPQFPSAPIAATYLTVTKKDGSI